MAQELESHGGGIDWEETFVGKAAIATPLPKSNNETAQDLEGSEHGWEDCTGEFLFCSRDAGYLVQSLPVYTEWPVLFLPFA